MPYSKTTWVSTVTAVDAAPMNNLETQYDQIVADYDLPIAILKTADETVNDDNVLQNDDELLFPVLANEVWQFTIYVRATTLAASDIKWSVVGPAGATITGGSLLPDPGGQQFFPLVTRSNTYVTADGYTAIVFGVAIIAATPGNVPFQWAQNVAIAEDTKVLENSCIIAHQLV